MQISSGGVILLSLIYFLLGLGFVYFYRELPDWFTSEQILFSKSMPGCLPGCINLALLGSPFFTIGLLYRKYESKLVIDSKLKIGLIFMALYILAVVIDNLFLKTKFIFATCRCDNIGLILIYFLIGMFSCICISKHVRHVKVINYIGANSLMFYYFNILMLRISGSVYNYILQALHISQIKSNLGYANYLIVSVLAIVSTIPIVWFVNKYMPILMGRKDAFINISKKLGLKIDW